MKKWIYCRVVYYQDYFEGLGEKKETETVSFKIYGQEETYKEYKPDYLSNLIGWLGNNGWEMINVTHTSYFNPENAQYVIEKYFFKKPIEE